MNRHQILNIKVGDYIYVNQPIYNKGTRIRRFAGKWNPMLVPNNFYKVLYEYHIYNFDDISDNMVMKLKGSGLALPINYKDPESYEEKGLLVYELYVDVETEVGRKRINLIGNRKEDYITKFLNMVKKKEYIELEDIDYFNL